MALGTSGDRHPRPQESQDGNRYPLVVVDRASKFLLAYPLPSKDAERGKSLAARTPFDPLSAAGVETFVPMA